MECVHCGADLDRGDVLEHYIRAYAGDVRRAAQAASAYGWSETNRVRFTRSVIAQPEHGPQFVQCPECKNTLPTEPRVSLGASEAAVSGPPGVLPNLA
jgi:hypothetical protein